MWTVFQEDESVRLLDRLGLPGGRTAKIIDGQHPESPQTSGVSPKPDMLPIENDDGQRATGKRNVLVAITGTELDRETVTLASTLARAKKSTVYIVYGIEVPRKLAIDAEMVEQTTIGNHALNEAAIVADQLNAHSECEIIQSRHFGQSVVEEARSHDCALVILGLPYRLGVGGQFELGETADYVLKNTACRVWLVRGQPVSAAEAEERKEPATVAR